MKLIKLANQLFTIPRSLAGKGNLETLNILSSKCKKKIKIKYFYSGTKFNGWTIPKEWKVDHAFILNKKKDRIVNFHRNNLELVIGSDSYNGYLSKRDLKKKIFTLKKYPQAIPYITNYYSKKFWGVCMSYNNYKKLSDEKYLVNIKTFKKLGKMHYGDLFIKGKSKKEIIFSTYICHPQMANNELSGPIVLSTLINKLIAYKARKELNFSYRFLFLPETIGTIAYINKNYQSIKKNVFSVFIATCLGTEKNFKLIYSRNGNTVADKMFEIILNKNYMKWQKRSYLERGSDERQWCSPEVNIPCCSVVTSKYGEYKQYHTSKDDLNFISEKGLLRSVNLYYSLFQEFEKSVFYVNKNIGEPKLDIYGVYPKWSTKKTKHHVKDIMNLLAYCDGTNNLEMLSYICKLKIQKVKRLTDFLFKKKIIKKL
jgi:aminopeptidase-like protein